MQGNPDGADPGEQPTRGRERRMRVMSDEQKAQLEAMQEPSDSWATLIQLIYAMIDLYIDMISAACRRIL